MCKGFLNGLRIRLLFSFSAARLRAFLLWEFKFNFQINKRQLLNQFNAEFAVLNVVTRPAADREVRRKFVCPHARPGFVDVGFDLGEDLTPGFEFVHTVIKKIKVPILVFLLDFQHTMSLRQPFFHKHQYGFALNHPQKLHIRSAAFG